MRKDITIEKIILGGEKVNKLADIKFDKVV